MSRIVRALAGLVVLLAPASAHAVFHVSHIGELMTGARGDPSIQYVEIRMDAASQNVTGGTRLTAFNCDGSTASVLLVVPSNVPNQGPGLHWIMASPSAAIFLGASGIAPDFIWNGTAAGAGIPASCGMVCWGAPGIVPPSPSSWNATDPNNYVDCVAYGPYTGPRKVSQHDGTSPSGTPTPLTPGGGSLSLTRVSTTGNNATDFALACPTPTNNAGATGAFGSCAPARCGDVNGDGVVDIGDALVVAQFDVGLRQCHSAPFTRPEFCDVNGDSACNIGDALRMAQCAVGLIGCNFTCQPFICR